VGPEGGFADRERELLAAQGAVSVSLGPRVLRAETAPIAALAAIHARWGDFSS
jgi:16S rRNA (uracil1498-N3)-methyltransferase